MLHILFFYLIIDCPNGFMPINNRCFRHLSTDDTFENHLKNCDKMLGRLLSVETMEANDPDYLVATKIMDANSKTTIFLLLLRMRASTDNDNFCLEMTIARLM